MRISLILAVSRNGVIGRDGTIPWRIGTDMRRFKALTMDKPIIMGRKQYDTIGLPLEGRDVYTMLVTQPGVTSDGATGRGLGLAINGQRPSASNRRKAP